MAHAARLNLRMQKELKLLLTGPPPGASFPLLSGGPDFSSLSTFDAQIEGPEGTAYATGIFSIKIQIPERYPFQPPNVTFLTPIYHPNIDNRGRICLDILNLPPKGAWQPSLNISTVLTSIGLLLSEPNPDDGLMCEASREYKYDRQVFDQKGRAMTEKYAKLGTSPGNCSSQSIQMDTSSSTMMEVKGLDKESVHKFQDFVSTHKRPCGIGGKLSLRSSSSTHNEGSDGDAKDMPNHHLLFDSQIHIERNEERKELRIIPDEYNLKYENPNGRGKKLSLESSVQYHEKDGYNTKGMNPKQSHSFFNQQTAATTSVGLPAQLVGNCNKQRLHHHDDKIQTFGSKSKSSKKLCEVSHKMQPRSFHAFKPNDSINEVMHVPPELLSSQSHSDSSETLSLPL